MVGFLMMTQVTSIDFRDVEMAIPAFLTILLMPLSYSITVGMGAGFVTYVLILVVRGKGRQIHALMYVIAALFILYFLRTPIEGAAQTLVSAIFG
jgi:AGZA family xanthine/uracil permease-like MFS transporter